MGFMSVSINLGKTNHLISQELNLGQLYTCQTGSGVLLRFEYNCKCPGAFDFHYRMSGVGARSIWVRCLFFVWLIRVILLL